jgi:trk system potassium uptake protein TrkA
MKRFVVVGVGHFGSWLVRALRDLGHDVLAIDTDPAVIDRNGTVGAKLVLGDATDVALLRQLDAASADAAVISTGDNLAAAVLATQALRDLGVRDVFVKVNSREATRVFETLGVSDTIFPEREAAIRLANRITSRSVFDYLPLARGYSMQEVAIPDAWIGKTLRELELPRRHRINVVAVFDVLTDQLNPVPDPDSPLKESDLAIVVGRDETIADVLRPPTGRA